MIVLRCTQRLLKTSALPISADPPDPPGALREWYANAVPLPMAGRWVVMYTSSETLLTVVVPGRTIGTTVAAFQRRVPALLHRLAVPGDWVEPQRLDRADLILARTASRRVLGSMNDLAHQIRMATGYSPGLEDIDWDRLEIDLARLPMSMLKYRSPAAAARAVVQDGSTTTE
jgi:hypothetical protein